jgi:hypothetical protein
VAKKIEVLLIVSLPTGRLSISEICIYSGRMSCQLLVKLEAIGKFNSVTWWDIYYNFSCAVILVLDIICDR